MSDVKKPPKEKAVRFGESGGLVGVLTSAPRSAEPRPGVLILNSGILHHIGACRLHVNLARTLAPAGFNVLRFDHAGIGDSEARKDTLPFVKSAPLDVREAMDWMTARKETSEFVLVGLCSGADMSFNVAIEDERVIGMVQMDAYAYRTTQYWVRHYGPKVLQPGPWVRFARRKARALMGRAERRMTREDLSEDYVPPEYRRRFPPRDVVADGLRALTGRGVHLLNIFTGGHGEHLNHAGQYRASFRDVRFGDLLEVDYVPDADHIFTGLAQQRAVVERIAGWFDARWSGAPAGRLAAAIA